MNRTLAITLVIFAVVIGAASAQGTTSGTTSAPAQTTPPPAAGQALNLNTATQAQLERLPGIGPATAARILEYRQKNGGFKRIEDLMNIRGIGEKSFLRLKPLVTVAPAKTIEARMPRTVLA